MYLTSRGKFSFSTVKPIPRLDKASTNQIETQSRDLFQLLRLPYNLVVTCCKHHRLDSMVLHEISEPGLATAATTHKFARKYFWQRHSIRFCVMGGLFCTTIHHKTSQCRGLLDLGVSENPAVELTFAWQIHVAVLHFHFRMCCPCDYGCPWTVVTRLVSESEQNWLFSDHISGILLNVSNRPYGMKLAVNPQQQSIWLEVSSLPRFYSTGYHSWNFPRVFADKARTLIAT